MKELKESLKARDSNRSLIQRWFKEDGSDQEEKEKTEKLLRSQTVIFDRLRRIIEEEFELSIRKSEEQDFNGNWAYREAHNHGVRKTLKKIYSILP